MAIPQEPAFILMKIGAKVTHIEALSNIFPPSAHHASFVSARTLVQIACLSALRPPLVLYRSIGKMTAHNIDADETLFVRSAIASCFHSSVRANAEDGVRPLCALRVFVHQGFACLGGITPLAWWSSGSTNGFRPLVLLNSSLSTIAPELFARRFSDSGFQSEAVSARIVPSYSRRLLYIQGLLTGTHSDQTQFAGREVQRPSWHLDVGRECGGVACRC